MVYYPDDKTLGTEIMGSGLIGDPGQGSSTGLFALSAPDIVLQPQSGSPFLGSQILGTVMMGLGLLGNTGNLDNTGYYIQTGYDNGYQKNLHNFGVHSSHSWTGYSNSWTKNLHNFGVHSSHSWTGYPNSYTNTFHNFGVHSSHSWTGIDGSYTKTMHEFGVHSNHTWSGYDNSYTKYMHLFGIHSSHNSTGGNATFVINRGLLNVSDNVIISPIPFLLKPYPPLPRVEGRKHNFIGKAKLYQFSNSRNHLIN